MTDPPIEPALTEAEWADWTVGGLQRVSDETAVAALPRPALIALLNHRLPSDDPRKITREKVRDLRATADALEHDGFGLNIAVPSLRRLADALESYIPPE